MSERSVYAKVFANPDGTRTAEISPDPIHFKNDAGAWKEIDNTLIPDPDGSGYRNKASALETHFASSASAADLISSGYGGETFAMGFEGATNAQPQVNGTSVIYPSIWAGADLKFDLSGESVKESLILNRRPQIAGKQLELRFPLSTSNLTAEKSNGEVRLTDAEGNETFTIPQLFMYDSSGGAVGEPAVSENISLNLETHGNKKFLRATVDGAWLTDPARVYPVVIDPSFSGRNPSLDTWVQSNIFNTPQNGSNELKSGTYDGGTTKAKSLVKFDLSDIPTGSSITDATLSLWENHSYSCTASQVDVYRVAEDWGSGVTWTNRPNFAASPAASKTVAKGYSSSCAADWVTFNVDSAISYWKNSSAVNYGFGIRAADETVTNGWKKFASAEAGNPPKLSVTYIPPNNPPTDPTSLSPADGTSSTDRSPKLSAVYHDPDAGDTGHVHFNVYLGSNFVVGGDGDTVSPGGTSNWTIPVGPSIPPDQELQEGKTYAWQARSDDGQLTSGSFVGPRSYHVIDQTPPGAPTGLTSPTHPETSPATPYSSKSGTVKWEAPSDASGIEGYSWNLNQVQDPSLGDTGFPDNAIDTTTKQDTFSGSAITEDGTYWFHVRAKDNEGNWGTTAGDFKIKIDTTPSTTPEVTSPSHGHEPGEIKWYRDNTPQFLVRSTDVSGVAGYTYWMDAASDPDPGLDPTTPSTTNPGWQEASLPAQSDGQHEFHVKSKDNAVPPNVSGQADYTIYIDSTAPTNLAIGSDTHPNQQSWYKDDSPRMEFHWSASDISGIGSYRYKLDQSSTWTGTGPDAEMTTSATSASTTYPAAGRQDTWYFHVQVKNGSQDAQWSNSQTFAVHLDAAGPVVVNLASDTHPDSDPSPGRDEWYRSTTPHITWDSTSGPSGIGSYAWSLDQINGTTPTAQKGTAKEAPSAGYPMPALSDGIYYFHVNATSNAGVTGATKHFPIRIDRNAPLAPTVLTSTSHTPGVASKTDKIDLEWGGATDPPAGTEQTSGIDKYRWELRSVAAGAGVGAPPSDDSPKTSLTNLQTTAQPDGRYYFHIQSIDKAGNPSSDEKVLGPILINHQDGTGLPPHLSLRGYDLVAQSDENGLEQFYPYRSFDVGLPTAYVQLHSGNLVVQEDDVTIPGQGLNAVIRHTYNSHRSDDVGLGTGWTLSLADADTGLDGTSSAALGIDLLDPVRIADGDMVGAVQEGAGRMLELTDADGTVHRFVRKGNSVGGTWESPPGVDLHLDEVSLDGLTADHYDLKRPDGVTYRIERPVPEGSTERGDTWHVTRITDRNSNQLELKYTRLQQALLGVVPLDYLRVSKVTLTGYDDPVACFEWDDASGNLTQILGRPGPNCSEVQQQTRITAFAVTAEHRLGSVTHNPDATAVGGKRVTTYHYPNESDPSPFTSPLTDEQKALLQSVEDGSGARTKFAYGTLSGNGTRPVTTITDRENNSWGFDYHFQTQDPTTGERTTTVSVPGEAGDLDYKVSGRNHISDSDRRYAGANILQITDAGTWADPLHSSVNRVVNKYVWDKNRLMQKILVKGGANEADATTSYEYNSLGAVTKMVSPAPNSATSGSVAATDAPTTPITTTYAYDSSLEDDYIAEMTSMTRDDQSGSGGSRPERVTLFAHDGEGNLEHVTEVANRSEDADRVTTFQYYDNGSMCTLNPPGRGDTDITTFGSKGPDGVCAGLAGDYHASGNPELVRDPLNGASKEFHYSDFGMLTYRKDSAGRVTTTDYDLRDNPTSVTVELDDTSDHVSAMSYDENDNLATSTSPRNFATTYGYDGVERRDSVEKPGKDTSTRSSSVTYNPDGTVDQRTNAADNSTSYTYHPNGAVETESAPAATGAPAVTRYLYDAAGRVSEITHPDVGATSDPTELREYTPQGRVAKVSQTSSTGAEDRIMEYAYDAFGELVQTQGPRSVGGTKEEQLVTFDSFGQKINVARRLTSSRWLDNTYTYNLSGTMATSSQPTGLPEDTGSKILETEYSYDLLDRLTEQTDPFNPDDGSGEGHTVSYTYKPEGQQETRKDFFNGVLQRKVTHTYNNDYTVQSVVATDETAPETPKPTIATCNWATGDVPGYGYDADGNLEDTRVVVGTSGCAGGRAIRSQTFDYDNGGWLEELTQRIDATDNDVADPVVRKQTLTYRDDHALKKSVWGGGSATDRTTLYTPSPGGFTESMQDWRTSNPTSTFTYKAAGNMSGATVANDAVATMTYHPDGSMKSLSWDKAGGALLRHHTAITYDIGGLRTSEQVSIAAAFGSSPTDLGGNATFDYDLVGRLRSWTSPFHLKSGDPADQSPTTAYSLDDGGNVRKATVTVSGTVDPRRTTTSTYLHGRLKGRTVSEGATDKSHSESLDYSSIGEQKTLTIDEKLLDVVTQTETVTTEHNPAGNVKKVTSDVKVGGVTADTSDVTYLYDPQGEVIARIKDDNTKRLYFYSAQGSLAEETNGAGGTKVRYLLGPEGPLAKQADDGTWTWLLPDPHGNVATLLKADGTVAEQKSYDPYGANDPEGSTGNGSADPESELGFQSAITDPETGKVLLGPRQYDPERQNFTTSDFYVGAGSDMTLGTDPLTGNRYLFAAANPVGFYDDGHHPLNAGHEGSDAPGVAVQAQILTDCDYDPDSCASGWSGVWDGTQRAAQAVATRAGHVARFLANAPRTAVAVGWASANRGSCDLEYGARVICYHTRAWANGEAEALTWGATITDMTEADYQENVDLQGHETRHATQSAVLGPLFEGIYVGGSAASYVLTGGGSTACLNPLEIDAGLREGDYKC